MGRTVILPHTKQVSRNLSHANKHSRKQRKAFLKWSTVFALASAFVEVISVQIKNLQLNNSFATLTPIQNVRTNADLFPASSSLFSVFTTDKCEKYQSRIICYDSNSQPLEHEPHPITTRPGLLHKLFCCCCCDVIVMNRQSVDLTDLRLWNHRVVAITEGRIFQSHLGLAVALNEKLLHAS